MRRAPKGAVQAGKGRQIAGATDGCVFWRRVLSLYKEKVYLFPYVDLYPYTYS